MLQKVLKKIREVNDLERLEFGCELKQIVNEKDYFLRYVGRNNSQMALLLLEKEELLFVPRLGKTCEIIGLPIHLEHLLRAMKLTGHSWEQVVVVGEVIKFAIPNDKVTHFIDEENGTPGENYNWNTADYDLTKSVEQNLTDNPELLNLVAELLKIN